MTIEWPFADDTEFQVSTIDKVEKAEGGYVLGHGGWSIYAASVGFEPAEGQTLRCYGRGIGHPVRGIVIDGHVVRYESPADYEVRREKEHAEYQEKRRLTMLEPKLPVPQLDGFEWTEDMREISGFGGGYERACRAMVSRGCQWLAEHPEADPQFHGFKGIYGVIVEDNDDARALSKAILGPEDGASGAMHQASVGHVMRWRTLGSWAAYQTEMRRMKIADEAAA